MRSPGFCAAAVLLLAGCSDPVLDDSGGRENIAAEARPGAASVAVPADAAREANGQGVMGAVEGPCGSARVAAYAGRRYTPELAEAVKARSGAKAVRVHRWDDSAPVDQALNERRLNLTLDQAGVIVLIDCG